VQEPCLSDEQLRELAALGARVEALFGAPQDVEWALDAAGTCWLVQARPITTLFPLPASAPAGDGDPSAGSGQALRVYFNGSVAQGVFRPLTPMGVQAIRLIGSSVAAAVGQPPRDPAAGPGIIAEAAYRLFIDVTPLVRSDLGRRLGRFALSRMEARSAALLDALAADPRLAPVPVSRRRLARALLLILGRTGLPWRVLHALLDPGAARRGAARAAARALALGDPSEAAGPAVIPSERLAAVERMLFEGGAQIPLSIGPFIPAGYGAFALAGRLLGGLASAEEKQAVLRGLPHNPTTEMDLRLWALARQVRADPAAAQAVSEWPHAQVVQAYRAGALPRTLQRGLDEFLRAYGHRGVAEIDLGLPRWSEDPTHILGALANYLQLGEQAQAPDVQFRRAAEQAEAMVVELSRRAARKGRLRGLVVRFCLGRARQLAGLREAPKFHFVSLLAKARRLLTPVGEALAGAGRLDTPDDVYFLTLPEARAAVAGSDQREVVRERRAGYQRELHRRHLPRVLLSDGTEPGAGTAAVPAGDGVLRGTPASAGTATARARVILDPHGARLEPGEILVAPSTDPGWTPLFLTAGGLVMEMGGSMSHGAVVAREYGLPAVVGVPGATERLRTGQRITVDGAAGTIVPAPGGPA
jgi:pyruvate,water dikinase